MYCKINFLGKYSLRRNNVYFRIYFKEIQLKFLIVLVLKSSRKIDDIRTFYNKINKLQCN